jgi:hypothetical protein
MFGLRIGEHYAPSFTHNFDVERDGDRRGVGVQPRQMLLTRKWDSAEGDERVENAVAEEKTSVARVDGAGRRPAHPYEIAAHRHVRARNAASIS